MTGYGRAEGIHLQRTFVVELRSVNHRYCDVVVRVPRFLSSLEEGIRKVIKGRFGRGRIDFSVTIHGSENIADRYQLDLDLARIYCDLLGRLKKTLHLSGEIDVALLSNIRDVIRVSEQELPVVPLGLAIEKTLVVAMIALEKMRKTEGRLLAEDLRDRLNVFSKRLTRIRTYEKKVVIAYQQRLKERISELSEEIKYDPVRLAQEVAIFAERSDISEERARLKAHVTHFRKMLRKEGPVGRSLDFLLQEMNREVNTLSSKSSDLALSLEAVEMKSDLEKIREQVQNIE